MRLLRIAFLIPLLPAALGAQSLEERVARAGTGIVHLSFPARPGVCGSGTTFSVRGGESDWEYECGPQPVRVALRVQERRVLGVRTYVGGRWRPAATAADLGTVRPQEAARFFLALAERGSDLMGDPVLPAALADSVTVWPALLKLARMPSLPAETRRTATFWLGQDAAAEAARALDSIAADPRGDREVRKQAVFALSQREGDGVPALIRIARSNPDPELRKTALFWLGQSDDPRALDLFEEILR
ncbi:MAG TPA: HEAT repeat domain-containing protein [Gemmatimonadales bacterium]